MSKKPVNDPLESAKVSKEAPKKSGWGKGRKPPADPKEDAPVAVETSAAPEPEPLVPVPAPAPVPAGPKKTPPGVFKFKILKTRSISRNGQITKMREGTIISSQHYGGPAGIAKLRSSGLELEEIA